MKIIFLFFIILSAFCLHSQAIVPENNRTRLQELSQRFYNEYNLKHDLALQAAEDNNWLIRGNLPDGSYTELQYIDDNGRPVYYITNNAIAAQSISTDEVYSGGSAGLSLNGAGIVYREWEVEPGYGAL